MGWVGWVNWQRVGQLSADLGQEWMGIHAMSKEASSPSKYKGIKGEKEYGLMGALLTCKYCKYVPVNNKKLCV